MVEPFYARYAAVSGQTEDFDDIVQQFVTMKRFARDAKTGLLYHGRDESREQRWADPQTGLSHEFWSRSMGWYLTALVDVLEDLPADHPRRGELSAIWNRVVPANLAKRRTPRLTRPPAPLLADDIPRAACACQTDPEKRREVFLVAGQGS